MADAALEASLASGLTTFLVMLFLALRKPYARPVPGTDERILVYGRGLRLFAFVGIGFVTLFTSGTVWAYALLPDHGGWTPEFIAILCIPFWLLVGGFAIEIFRASCRFSPRAITRHSPWKGTVVVRWDEIESIRYDLTGAWYVLRTPGGKIHLEPYLDGIEEFLRVAREHVPPAKWDAGIRSS